MKKIYFIMIICAVLVAAASCGGDSPADADEAGGGIIQDSQDNGTEQEAEDPRFTIREDIPDLDFGGINFNIIYPLWSMYGDYYFAEEEIGEALNDAIYKRQNNVEERLNIKIVPINNGYRDNDYYNNVMRSVRAGSDDYQLVLTHCLYGVPEMCTQGLVLDWNSIPITDFTKPWWNQRMNDTMSINGILLTAAGDFLIFDPNVIYFNKQMTADLDLGDIYQTVKDGQWTWRKMTELARLASMDLNGDGVFDKDDRYGFVINLQWMMNSAVQSSGMLISKIEDGYHVNNLNSERFGSFMDMLHELVYAGNQTFISTWDPNQTTDNESEIPMSSSRVLFHLDPLSAGKRYRTYDVEFGILPLPKYDETQQEYLSLSWNGFMMVPVTADPELAGAAAEALSAESYRLTVPAYYDVLLTSKVARDVESTEMLDIIFKGAVYDFALNFGNWNPITFVVDQMLQQKSTDYASFMERHEDSFHRRMREIYDSIIEHYGG